MKKTTHIIGTMGLLISCFILASAFAATETAIIISKSPLSENLETELKEKALDILQIKCNACHRKQNPFKIFSLKNMDRHAPKIHEQVFVKKRMPKGEKIQLTAEEYQILKNWLQNQNIK